MGEIKDDVNMKREKYVGYLKKELVLLEQIKFDGYLYLLYELSTYAKMRDITCEFYGSIQNSLLAYLLGIVSDFEFYSSGDIINFTPFLKEPTVNIVCQKDIKYELIDFVNRSYGYLIKSSKTHIEFLEPLKIKFFNLNNRVNNAITKEEAIFLGLKVREVNINFSTVHSRLIKQNEIILGFDSLGFAQIQIHKILRERNENGMFKDFEDFLKRANLRYFTNKHLAVIQKIMDKN